MPVGPFPPPALRTGRADLPHPALQWDHATRTRNASSEPLPAIAGHPRYRWLCVPPAPRSCTASPRCPSPTRRQTCSRPDSTDPPIGQPGPFAYACDASELPAPSRGVHRQSHSRGPSPLRHSSFDPRSRRRAGSPSGRGAGHLPHAIAVRTASLHRRRRATRCCPRPRRPRSKLRQEG